MQVARDKGSPKQRLPCLLSKQNKQQEGRIELHENHAWQLENQERPGLKVTSVQTPLPLPSPGPPLGPHRLYDEQTGGGRGAATESKGLAHPHPPHEATIT